jgi:hypothetical protein
MSVLCNSEFEFPINEHQGQLVMQTGKERVWKVPVIQLMYFICSIYFDCWVGVCVEIYSDLVTLQICNYFNDHILDYLF